MKEFFYLVGLILCPLFAQVTRAQSGQDTTLLIEGRWSLDFEQSLARASDQTITKYRQLSPALQDDLKTGFDGQILQCQPQGVCTLLSPSGKSQSGRWSLSADQRQLHLTMDSGYATTLTITVLSEDHLAFNLGEDNVESALFKDWYYKKI